MADIVVFERATKATNENASRRAGMALLGERFNWHFMNPPPEPPNNDDKVVNNTIQDIINNFTDFQVTYKGDNNELTIFGIPSSGRYLYDAGPPRRLVRLKGKRDRPEVGNNVMNIALPEGNGDLIGGATYLTKVLQDLGFAVPTEEFQQYLLATITFRRCR